MSLIAGHSLARMTEDSVPDSTWDKADRLLGGGMVSVRSVPVPVDQRTFGAVAFTLRVPPGQFQVDEDGNLTATVLLGPGEALGIGPMVSRGWPAADAIGPPLFDWAPDEPADGAERYARNGSVARTLRNGSVEGGQTVA